MPAGRPVKPTEQKRALGNPGKRALPTPVQLLEPIMATPTPSRELQAAGAELWQRVWESGARWISPSTDFELLLMTCEMVDDRLALRNQLVADNDPRTRRGLRELERAIVGNLSLLGFSPADRTRLGLAEVKAQSKLAALLAQKD
jgi:hypothetical protein